MGVGRHGLGRRETGAAWAASPSARKPFPSWPVGTAARTRRCWRWSTAANGSAAAAKRSDQFEEAYAKLTGAKYCVATNSGTSALLTSLGAWASGRATK